MGQVRDLEEIIISNQDLNEILLCVGITQSLLEVGDLELTLDEIKQLCIRPAMREYYKYFPIIIEEQQTVTTNFAINFPDEYTYGAVKVSLNPTNTSSGITTNPLINQLLINNAGSSNYWKQYGTRYDYGMREASYTLEAETQSNIERYKSIKYRIDTNNRQIVGYTNIQGLLSIHWAKFSENFNSIEYSRKQEVIKLSQSFLMKALGRIRTIQNSNLPNDFNFQAMLDEADAIYADIQKRWQEFTKVVVIR